MLALGVLDKPSVIIFRLADERPSGALVLIEDTRYRVQPMHAVRIELRTPRHAAAHRAGSDRAKIRQRGSG